MIRLALIGVGKWGKNIVSTLETLSGADLRYLCALEKNLLAGYPPRYIKILDWRDLLEKQDVDAVIIATPPSTHAFMAEAFLKRGISVFIEKPMTQNLKEAKRLRQTASNSNAVVFVGHIHLYNPAYAALKKTVLKSGRILSIDTKAGNVGPFREDYSALWDWAPHDLAVILDLARNEPERVQAWGLSVLRPGTRLYDKVFIRLGFADGLEATVCVSSLDLVKNKKISVITTKCVGILDDTLADKKVAVFRGVFSTNGYLNDSASPVQKKMQIIHLSYGKESPLIMEMKEFIECVKNKKKPLSDIEQGLSVVRILDAAERSIRCGGKEIFFK